MLVYEYQTLSCRKAAVIRLKYYGNDLEHFRKSIKFAEMKFSENFVIYRLKKKDVYNP